MRFNQKAALGTNCWLWALRRFDEEITKSDLDGRVNMKLGLLYGDQAVRIHQAGDNHRYHLRNADSIYR